MRKTIIAAFTFALLSTAVLAEETRFLSVDMTITEQGEPISVKVNLPLTVVSSFLPQINEALEHADLEEHNVDLKNIWSEIRAAGPNEYVNIEQADGHVVVSTDDDNVTISVEHPEEGQLKVVIPLALGDLILGEEGASTPEDILAALEEWEGDLVNITGDKVNGRVWIQ